MTHVCVYAAGCVFYARQFLCVGETLCVCEVLLDPICVKDTICMCGRPRARVRACVEPVGQREPGWLAAVVTACLGGALG